MGKKHNYSTKIRALLQGYMDEYSDIPQERVDWSGASEVVKLIQNAKARERVHIVDALCDIIETPVKEDLEMIAQAIHIASSLGIVDAKPHVDKLKKYYEGFASLEPLKSAITNYDAFVIQDLNEKSTLTKKSKTRDL